jgi:hypothetical protein
VIQRSSAEDLWSVSPPVSRNDLSRPRIHPVPEEFLADALVERIVTETLLVGGMAVPRVPSDNVDLDMAEEDAQSKLLDSLRDLHAGSSGLVIGIALE